MNDTEQRIQLENQWLTLLPERALFWEQQQTLIVADPHLGKAASFRASAIPVPGGTTQEDLARLSQLLAHTQAQRLLILGDLLHAKTGRSPTVIADVSAWRAGHTGVEMYLVRGNHDRWAGDPPPAWEMVCLNEPFPEPPFVFRHYPEATEQGYTLAGHLHPAVRLTGLGRQQLKLPCFYFGVRVGILPAFGTFTGTALVRAQPGDRIYVVASGEIVALPG